MSSKDEYLQRAKEADEKAAGAQDARVKEDWRIIAEGYRDLARRQPDGRRADENHSGTIIQGKK